MKDVNRAKAIQLSQLCTKKVSFSQNGIMHGRQNYSLNHRIDSYFFIFFFEKGEKLFVLFAIVDMFQVKTWGFWF